MSKVSYYTAEGLKKLKDELNQLKDVERPKASQANKSVFIRKNFTNKRGNYSVLLLVNKKQCCLKQTRSSPVF